MKYGHLAPPPPNNCRLMHALKCHMILTDAKGSKIYEKNICAMILNCENVHVYKLNMYNERIEGND